MGEHRDVTILNAPCFLSCLGKTDTSLRLAGSVRLTRNLEGNLEVTAKCNQCSEALTINRVERASSVSQEVLVGTVRPESASLMKMVRP